MAFIDELADKLGLTVGESVGGCKVTVYGRSGVIAGTEDCIITTTRQSRLGSRTAS